VGAELPLAFYPNKPIETSTGHQTWNKQQPRQCPTNKPKPVGCCRGFYYMSVDKFDNLAN
jgi:hypothetical protein